MARLAKAEAAWRERQRAVALKCFRIVNGPGDAGSEGEFNCRRVTEQSGWIRLSARIIRRNLEISAWKNPS